VGREDEAVALVAHEIPYLGLIAGPFAAALGAVILAISANSGVMSASRLTYCMSRYQLLSTWFDKVHPKYRTPARTIIFFSMVGVVELVLAFLTPGVMDTLGNMYAFGATLGYTLVFISLIRLRFSDPYSPRPYKMPLNLRWKRHGRIVDVPILGFIGMLGVMTILFEVILTHEIGRVAGPAWVLACLAYYVWYRRRQKLPLGTIKRDWEKEQVQVLTSAEEYELLEEYKEALASRDRGGPS
jgi:APA family basic amino acid/polyamine antiporter